MKKKLLLILTVLTFSFVSNSQIGGYAVGATVSNFTVTDTEGHTHDLHTITASGKYVYIDFFFDTCGPCQSVSPIFNEFYDKYGCNAGDIYCITMNNGSDSDAEVITYEQTYGGTFHHAPAVSSDGGAAAVNAAFNPAAYPTICLIGPDNKMINTDVWPVSDVAAFEATFPAGFSPSPIACSFASVEKTVINELSIYPNPATDNVNINFSTITSNQVEIVITNIIGEIIETVSINSKIGNNIAQLNTNDYPKGHYFVSINSNNQITTSKFIVNK